MTLNNVILDIATISFLLFISFFIRQKITFLQKSFIPVSLIAGTLGLLLGPQVLGKFSPIHINFSEYIGQWTSFLFCFIFSTSFLGITAKKFGRDVLSTTFITGSIHMMQVCVGLAISFLLSRVMSNVPFEIGLLPVAGFYGGHGSAGIIGGSFANEGWEDAMGIAMTYATIGMFAATIFGMVLVNWGAKRKYVKREMSSTYLEEKDMTGIIPKENRQPAAVEIANPSVIDPMAFQLMIVGTIIGISHIIRISIIKVLPFWERIPLYTMCLLIGALLGNFLSKTKFNNLIDRASMKRISGVALEFVIAAAVATIKLSVLASFLVPILISSVVICLLTAVFAIYLSKKWYGEDWFEVAMGAYGQCTGSLATGLLLIKVIDPEGETLAAESISGSSTLGSAFQLPYTTMGPMFLMASPLMFSFGSFGIFLAFLILGTILFRRGAKRA
ncbi:sodium/glutamate symporter [Peptoniphilus harei]|uniref:sodium/glutamate symporter n=1 Tax=Peptoniphilus harei TaxID=54005 RepID=UPI0011DD1F0E|nr:sodium/glutamate symporter [Peptoniphilus harei]MDK7354357.1 sodium/glutamate symporter [Peptoniphilus harei]MDK7370015.1 sodium/glutamate symporter [Peptoniphilus harei]